MGHTHGANIVMVVLLAVALGCSGGDPGRPNPEAATVTSAKATAPLAQKPASHAVPHAHATILHPAFSRLAVKALTASSNRSDRQVVDNALLEAESEATNDAAGLGLYFRSTNATRDPRTE
jgi:hypothetical protein